VYSAGRLRFRLRFRELEQEWGTMKGKKLVRPAQLSLLCMVNLVGYMFRPYMRVIFRPLQRT